MSPLGPFTRPWQDVSQEGHHSYDLLKHVFLDTMANHYSTCKLRWGLGGGLGGGVIELGRERDLGNEVASKRLVFLFFPNHILKKLCHS